jgi:hypothetical protein
VEGYIEPGRRLHSAQIIRWRVPYESIVPRRRLHSAQILQKVGYIVPRENRLHSAQQILNSLKINGSSSERFKWVGVIEVIEQIAKGRRQILVCRMKSWQCNIKHVNEYDVNGLLKTWVDCRDEGGSCFFPE